MAAEIINIHPTHPQGRAISRVAEALHNGSVIIYPTDSCYAFGCNVGDKSALDRIRTLRDSGDKHHFTLVCRDLSDLGNYARVDNQAYRFIRTLTPGPYTFLLRASREVPRRLQSPNRKTIGLRVPQHAIVQALLDALGEPIMSSTVLLAGDDNPLADADSIVARLGHGVDLIVDGGPCGIDQTTVIDLSKDRPIIVRAGKGTVDDVLQPES